MKTLTWIVCVLILSSLHPAQAAQTRVLKVELQASASEPTLVYLEDGRLLRINPQDENTLNELKTVEITGDSIDFTADRIGAYHAISHFAVMPAQPDDSFKNFNSGTSVNADYVPTDLGTLDAAKAQFKKLTWNMRRRSQCYQRAENWVYEMWTSSQIQSQKVFMFFTRKYIRQYNYDWWFHVTPFVLAAGTEYAMDRTFITEPKTLPDWTSNFMPKNVNCKVIDKYSDYENNQEAELCYHIKVPMYYFQPKDVEAMEKGTFVTEFIPWELAFARRAYAK